MHNHSKRTKLKHIDTRNLSTKNQMKETKESQKDIDIVQYIHCMNNRIHCLLLYDLTIIYYSRSSTESMNQSELFAFKRSCFTSDLHTVFFSLTVHTMLSTMLQLYSTNGTTSFVCLFVSGDSRLSFVEKLRN